MPDEAKPREGGRDILSGDITPLIEGNKKIAASTIDAINGNLQVLAKANGCSHWAVLSAWLGPLVEGTVQEGKYVGTIP
ncbi:hypothetical protein H2248_002464 [Termitomyces sp. 'cryptogamus']|nr:hypothetical protein H2248_002464 [Termitomyces sp. 'cryptogamus']